MAQVKQSCWGCECEQAQDWPCSCGLLSQQLPSPPSLLAKLLAGPACNIQHKQITRCQVLRLFQLPCFSSTAKMLLLELHYLRHVIATSPVGFPPLKAVKLAHYQDTQQCVQVERGVPSEVSGELEGLRSCDSCRCPVLCLALLDPCAPAYAHHPVTVHYNLDDLAVQRVASESDVAYMSSPPGTTG